MKQILGFSLLAGVCFGLICYVITTDIAMTLFLTGGSALSLAWLGIKNK